MVLDGAGLLVHVVSRSVEKLVKGAEARDDRDIEDGVRGLIGIGPGLTPSGDDLLAGLVIGLIATNGSPDRTNYRHRVEGAATQGLSEVISALAGSIVRHAAGGTTQISNVLLSHAVKGVGSDSVHRLLQALLQRNDPPEPTQAALNLAILGHTSGWDCIAGILVGVHLGLCLRETPGAGRDGYARLKTAA